MRYCGVCHTDLHIVEGDIQPSLTPITPTTTLYPLEAANQALDDLKHSRTHGEAVLEIAAED